MFERLPHEMRSFRQWICWKAELKPNGKTDKIPINPNTGQPALIDNPSTWTDYDTAVNASVNWSGIGFVFTQDDPFTGIDLDDTEGNAVETERQLKIYQAFDSYSERSPSGNGLHIIVKGYVPHGKHPKYYGVFSAGRYFTMTGNVFNDAPIQERQQLLDKLWIELGGGGRILAVRSTPQTDDDLTIYNRAKDASNGDKFLTLYNGQWEDLGYPSQSEADFALVDIVAFYTQNTEQIERLFYASALGSRDKAKRLKYLRAMINRSFDRQTPPVDLSGLHIGISVAMNGAPVAGSHVNGDSVSVPGLSSQGSPRPLDSSPASALNGVGGRSVFSLPPGLMGSLAQFFYRASPRQVHEIALTAAIGLMAGICGRSFNVSNTGLNMYVMLIAPTGRGKEAMADGIDRLFNACMAGPPLIPALNEFRGPSIIGSEQGLIKKLLVSPSLFSILGEFGKELEIMSQPNAPAYKKGLLKCFVDLYHKSGHGRTYQPIVYSDTAKNTLAVQSPSFTILAEAAGETFWNVIDETMVQDGLLPRFVFVDYDGIRVRFNKDHNDTQPPPELVREFKQLVAVALNLGRNVDGQRHVCPVVLDENAQSLADAFDHFCDDEINNAGSVVMSQLWNRAHLNSLKLAALVAVGCNHTFPMITGEIYIWARNIIAHMIDKMINRFAVGDAGKKTEESKQDKDLRASIKAYFRNSSELAVKYGATELMFNARVIPYSYFNKRLSAMASFRNDRMGSTNALKRQIQQFVDMGILRELPKNQTSQQFNCSARCYALADPTLLV